MKRINLLIFFIYSVFFFIKELKDFFTQIKEKFDNYFYININILRNKNIKKFLKGNKKLFEKNFQNSEKSKKYILVETIISHPAYIANQLIIAKYIEKILQINLKSLVLKDNFLQKKMRDSYLIQTTTKIKNQNIFKRYFRFLKNLKKLNNITLKEFKEITSGKVKIGEIVYDHYIRFTGDLDVYMLNFKLIYFYFIALEYDFFIKNIIKDENCEGIVLCETQFIPSAIFFQNMLENNKKVYARYGGPKKIGVRIYDRFEEIYNWKQKFKKQDLEKIKQTNRVKAENDGYQIIFDRITGNQKNQDLNDTAIAYSKKQDFSKSELCELFNWDPQKPIIGIYDHSYTDGLFICGRSIFETNYAWIKFTLEFIKNCKEVNWIVKPHPIKSYETHPANMGTIKVFNKIINSDNNNIKIFPEYISAFSLFKILSTVITGNGSVGLEYTTNGIPAVLANHSHYSGLGFTIEPKNINEYKDILSNINKLKKLDNDQILNSRIFVSVELNKSLSDLSLLPKFIPNSQIFFKENYDNFWKKMSEQVKMYNLEKDDLFKEFKKQLMEKKTHTINFNYQ